MSDSDTYAILPSLRSHADRLNSLSDKANSVLADIEKRLVELNIGLEVWGPVLDREPTDVPLKPDEHMAEVVQLLGFAKIEGRWRLAVKSVQYVHGLFQGDDNAPYANPSAGSWKPLLDCPRDLRIAALRTLPEFLATVDQHVASAVETVEAAVNQYGSEGRG